MKYYKRLWKNKDYGKLIGILIFFGLGFFCFYVNFLEYLIKGFQKTNINGYTMDTIAGILGSSNIGLTIVGLIVMYTGLIFVPRNIPEIQNDDDYYVKSKGSKIYIKYKNYEFELNKETFEPTDMIWKDKNKKFVSVTLAYQIYNYVTYKYRHLLEKQVPNFADKENILTNYENIKSATDEEINNYIIFKGFNKNKPLSKSIGILYIILSIIFVLGILFNNKYSILKKCAVLLFSSVLFVPAYTFYNEATHNKKNLNKIKKSKIYIAPAYVFDKKIEQSDSEYTYFVKVSDKKNHYIDEWFKISKEDYQNDLIEGKLYIIEYQNNYNFDFICSKEIS